MPIQISGVQLGAVSGGPSSIALGDLSDVSIVGPQTGQYLRYNSGISEWQNANLGSDVYNFLNTNLTASNGIALTFTPGPNTIDIALGLSATGDATGTVSSGVLPLTLATVNANVGTFGSSSQIPVVTVNAKGLITGISTVTFSGTTPLASNLAGGSAGSIPYQTSANNTAFLAAGTSSQVLIGGATPSWSSSISGLTAVSATTFTGTLSGNASTASALQTTRSISATGDAAWTVNFNGSANASGTLTLATVNANVGTFASVTVNDKGLVTSASALSGDATTTNSVLTLATVNSSPQTNQFRKITVNGKGLVTATTSVSSADITTALGFTPVNRAGDTMTGLLVLSGDPVSALGAVTKQYADSIASGINVHASALVSTTTTLASSSGGTITYDNGASGVGATLTTTGSFATIDGVSTSNGSRILVKDEVAQATNGIYVRTSTTVLTRATDFDTAGPGEIAAGALIYIQSGTLTGTQWSQITSGSITVGTTPIVFTQYSGSVTYSAGTGLSLLGTTFSNTGVLSNLAGSGISVSGSTGNVTISNLGVVSLSGTTNQISVSASSGSVTVGLPTSVTISGTMTAGTFSGSGASLTNIPNASLTNSSITVGSTSIALGASSTVLAGLTSVTSSTFIGALTGNATTATTSTNIAGGAAGSIVYQTGAGTSALLAAGTSSQVLVSGTTPSWTNTPTLTGTNFSGTAASLNIGGNAGTATALQTARTINGTSFNGTANITITANTTNSLTFNNAGTGAVSGTTFNGGTAQTISYNTIGAPSTTGTNASGTWPISITGNSVTVGGFTPSSTSGVASRVVVADSNGYIFNTYFNGVDEGTNGTAGTVSGILAKRGDNYYRTTTAQSIATYLSGSTMNIVGNASTSSNVSNISNAVGGTYTWTGNQNFLSGTPVGLGSQSGTLSAYGNTAATNAAVMSFHRPGVYAINMGLDTDNVFRIGGWSDGASTYRLQLDTSGSLTVRGVIAPNNGSNYLRSVTGTYGTLEMVGTGSSYAGLSLHSSASGTVVGMFDTSGNGGNYDPTTSWHFYWVRSQSCLALGGSTGAAGYRARTNGNHMVDGNLLANNGKVIASIDSSVPSIGNAGDIIVRRSTTQGVVYFGDSGTRYLYYDGTNYNLNGTGLIVSGDVTAFSDIRVKKNIEVIPDALNKVLQVRGVTFQRTDIDDDTRHTGVIAQELEKVLPEAVITSEESLDGGEGKKTVAYGNVVGLLIEAIKELNAKVESLQAEIKSLKG